MIPEKERYIPKSPSIPIRPLPPKKPSSNMHFPLHELSPNSPTEELDVFMQMKNLSVSDYKETEKTISKKLARLGKESFGFTKTDIDRITSSVVPNMSRTTGTFYQKNKDTNIPYSIYFNYDKQQAFVFLKNDKKVPEPLNAPAALRISWVSKGSGSFLSAKVEVSKKPVICDVKSKLIKGLNKLGINFHGLSGEQIHDIVEAIDFTLGDKQRSGICFHKKDLALPRTVRYNHDTNEAFVFLKSKQILPQALGGFRRGTRAIRIVWQNADGRDKIIKSIHVEKAFQLVSLDDRQNLKIVHKMPFERRVQQLLPQDLYERFECQLVKCYDFFQYEKVKKVTKEKIVKSCALVPFYQDTMHELLHEKTLNYGNVIAIAHRVLLQLVAWHKAGIIHGDIKPGNILIDSKGKPKLGDYDFSVMYELEPTAWMKNFYGTCTYTAPELLEGQTDRKIQTHQHPKADMYALGITLFEALEALGYITPLVWLESLRTYRKFPSEELLTKIINKQNEVKVFAEQAVKTISKQKTDENFLMDLACLMIHPDPDARITAEEALAIINKTYDMTGE